MGFKLGDKVSSEFNEQLSSYGNDSTQPVSAWQSSSSPSSYSSVGYSGGYDLYQSYTPPTGPAVLMWEWRTYDNNFFNSGSRHGSVEIKECPPTMTGPPTSLLIK